VNRVALAAAAAATLTLAVLAALAGSTGSLAHSSTLYAGAQGWMAARRYLEARGHEARVLREPQPPSRGDVLVSAFPWQDTDAPAAAVRHVRAGGTLLLAYDGESLSVSENELLSALGLEWRSVGVRPPLHPLRWREAVSREWRLAREGDTAAAAAVVIRARRRLPAPPRGARVLYRAPGGWPVVFEMDLDRGRVIVLPAEALSNARLFERGNADLLESLSRALVEPWWFDEYHHGLSMPASELLPRSTMAFDLVALHLALLYVLAATAMARRFGPAWSEPPATTGSTGKFLLGLGVMHHRLGHHQAAARLLLERAQQLDRGFTPSPAMVRTAHAATATELVELAREVTPAASRPA
jgi:hypothetical protein